MKTVHSQEPNSVPLTCFSYESLCLCLLKAIKKKYCLQENCLSVYFLQKCIWIKMNQWFHLLGCVTEMSMVLTANNEIKFIK